MVSRMPCDEKIDAIPLSRQQTTRKYGHLDVVILLS